MNIMNDDDDDDELQAGALVIIYKDGSVLITHGGTEMGQGLHTKMIQVYCNVCCRMNLWN